MTDARSPSALEARQAVREIIRRSGHEIRNALNAVAVNVEVVRSRSARDKAGDAAAFAERASSGVREASTLTDGLLALVAAVMAAEEQGALTTVGEQAGGSRIELKTYGASGERLVSDIEPLAGRIGVGVERLGQNVILTVSPQG